MCWQRKVPFSSTNGFLNHFMNLLTRFLPKTEFSSYDEFYRDCKINVPDDFNFVYDVVDFYAREVPQQRALVWCDDNGESKEFTFKQLAEQSLIAAAFLQEQGISKGDIVMLCLHRRYEYWIFLLALHRLGAVAFPVSSQLTKKDIEYRLAACMVRLIITPEFLQEQWEPYASTQKAELPEITRPELSVNDPMLLYYTSGTQGEPKPVMHNWLYPLAHIITAKYWQKNIDGGLHYSMAETGWAKASWGKIYGQWICGSAVFVYDRKKFNPQTVLQKISEYKVNTFCAPPVFYRYLMELDFSKYDLSCLKHCCAAGESLNPKIAQGFYEKTGLHIYEGYGQTETALLCANFDFTDCEPHSGCLGRPSPLYNLSLDEAGEIIIDITKSKPLGLFTNYPKSAAGEGFYRTGDLATKDAQGLYFFIGRKDNIIKSAGFRISPFEVEDIINECPLVAESYVYGQEDPKRGHIVTAQIVLKPGLEPDKNMERQLLDFVRERTALYKCPRKIEIVKELIKTYNGKIKRGGKSEGEN